MLRGPVFEVCAGARRTELMAELNAEGIRVLPLDVTDEASMRFFVDAVLAGAGRIDVLVNNAGLGGYGAVEDLPLDVATHPRTRYAVGTGARAAVTARRVSPAAAGW